MLVPPTIVKSSRSYVRPLRSTKLRPSSATAVTPGRSYSRPLNSASSPFISLSTVARETSTAVMSVLPWLSAFRTSRPPPAPMLSTRGYFRPIA